MMTHIYSVDILAMILYTVFTVFLELFDEFIGWQLRRCLERFVRRSTPTMGVLRLFLFDNVPGMHSGLHRKIKKIGGIPKQNTVWLGAKL